MASIKEYNVKLASLKNTRKMTKTMKMVSASKLQRALSAQRNARLYATKLGELVSRLSASVDASSHPLLTRHDPCSNALVLMFTSDKGLCGGFNNNLAKTTSTWIDDNRQNFDNIHMSFCGRRGYMFFKSRAEVRTHYEDITQRPTFADAAHLGEEMEKLFTEGEYDEIYLAYNIFHSPLSQKPNIEKLLPIEPQEVITEEETPFSLEYIFEPEQEELLTFLLPRIMYFKLYFTLLENAAGEHGARMTAMDSATTNADKLVDKYTLLRNRARQAEITTELTEIISGAEAL